MNCTVWFEENKELSDFAVLMLIHDLLMLGFPKLISVHRRGRTVFASTSLPQSVSRPMTD
ncbi:hypothetical protein VCRA2116O29_110071 [Vibrio crassostreae]|nr:hypothetical protein VCRA2116O29_110071 [Vibrio crassostreae]CAK2440415.1 hypothetical protein VCRA2119O48_210001 [Vibrio crassostreae]CAK3565935.1 hypothetical protein VCRA2123O74_110031 [Vibrio crassostreae]CAK3842097.1 hypothetical protein VCRA212O16_220002 [Vibrio crassostreae]